jgi:osmotically-inducible protein OsmY
MKSNLMKHLSNALSFSIAGALALGLAACDLTPTADNPGRTFDSFAENAAHSLEPPAVTAAQNIGQPFHAASDAELAARVKAAIDGEPGLGSVNVDVNAVDGVVTLYGIADTPGKRHQAAMVALNVGGVRSVRNAMVIVKGS